MSFKSLHAYQNGFELAMDIFQVSKRFPSEEKYSLTDQIRRSSRSTCANLAEAYRKRQYPKHFLSKISDSDAENSETQTWLEFSLNCGYIEKEVYDLLLRKSNEVGRLLEYMLRNPNKFQ